MAAAISTTRFAELVTDRLIDAYGVAQLMGYRQTQSVYDAVERGTLPPPIIKVERAYAFWDRLAITRR